MPLTFSLLFTYHIKAVLCRRRGAQHAAPSIILLFTAQAVASVLFTFAPDACSILSFILFFNLQALLIYFDAAHDLITQGGNDARTLTGGVGEGLRGTRN